MQIWYVVSKSYFEEFLASVPEYHCLVSKTWYPPQPTEQQLRDGKITRIVQRPGDLVITEPVSLLGFELFNGNRRIRPSLDSMSLQGRVFHWTLSCGRSVCESANYFIQTPALGMKDCLETCIKEYQQWSDQAPTPVTTFLRERVQSAKAMAEDTDFLADLSD